ncbi:hypothetical protein UFOVP655_81 [uncultured Caudovirales phage]|uniref:Uncharacterized protein n=1 Tax=uncultured Caudovirales phage TaxID=2100421 RepID=A0A6J5NMT8_9CAUD|nr:hypothetical protein UFOVP655_81 [uncultured Caudovirales phage]
MEAIYSKVSEFMNDTVVFTGKSSVDKYNKPTFGGTETTATGRLIYETTRSRDVQGIEVVDVGRFICLGPQTAITNNHKMVVGSEVFTINSVSDIKDENGFHHTVVRFGR